MTTLVLIVVIALLGFGLAWLVGRKADADKAERGGDQFEARHPGTTRPPAGRQDPQQRPAVPEGACPTCRTRYEEGLDFCTACGRRRDRT